MAANPDENMERGLMIMAQLKKREEKEEGNKGKAFFIIAFHSNGHGGSL
jgi:hypothetical protein